MQILLQLINVMSCDIHNFDEYANEHNINYAEIRMSLDLLRKLVLQWLCKCLQLPDLS